MTLDELERLEAQATPAPWEVWQGDASAHLYRPTDDPHYRDNLANVYCFDPNGNARRPGRGNAALIAAARNALRRHLRIERAARAYLAAQATQPPPQDVAAWGERVAAAERELRAALEEGEA